MGAVEEPSSKIPLHYGPRLPKSLTQFKQWLSQHHMTLVAINDTPHSIALGSALGFAFGFTPLTGIKTLLSFFTAWVLRCNKVAAIIAVTVHDVLIFIMPAVYYAEYKAGCWILGRPAPAKMRFHFALHDYLSWHVFHHIVWPVLIGSLFLALPSGVIVYFLLRLLVTRSRTASAPE